MRHIVGVADMKISNQPGDIVVTYALGSCLGIAVHDPVSQVGGILHVMLPVSSVNPDKARVNPFMFVDTGVPMLFHQLYAAGGVKSRLVLKVAGGANVQGRDDDRFAIGKRNNLMLRKLLWKNGVMVKGEDVGGISARTMYLEVGTGRTWVASAGVEKEL